MASGPTTTHVNYNSDDFFCSHDDYTNEDSSSVTHIDSSKDFHVSRMAKTSTFPATAINSPEGSLGQDVIATVEKSMKTNTDTLMRFLEGISSRLSQLELYCYNLDKSIGEMRSELTIDHEEADSKLKSLDKHLQEVHRSVQILRDKQELAETQKELAKLRVARKGSSSSIHSQSNEEKFPPSATEQKRTDNASFTLSEPHNQQLTLALSHQVAFQPQPMTPSSEVPAPNVTQTTQQPRYYMLPMPSPTPPAATQLPLNQNFPSGPQYQYHPSTTSQVTQSLTVPQFSQYQQPQQQWPQQLAPQVQPLQSPSMHSQMKRPSVNGYAPYLTSQATSPPPSGTLPNNLPIQNPYSGIQPAGNSNGDPIPLPYGYNGTGRTVPQQSPPQQIKGHFPSQPGYLYGNSGSTVTPPPASAYMMNKGEGGRANYPPQPSQFAQGGYPPAPSTPSLQNSVPHNLTVRNPSQPSLIRNHPYNELIENLVTMGVRGDLVVSIIERMEETGQPINFNSVLDRLNVHSSLGVQRGWSG